MMKKVAIFGDGRLVVIMLVILVIFLSASITLASSTTAEAQSIAPHANESAELSSAASPSAFSCNEGLVNGGFEDRTAWILRTTQYTASYTDQLIRSGSWSVRTGITNPLHNKYSYSSVYQTVVLPADATRITLNFWIFPRTTEPESIPLILPKNPIGLREEVPPPEYDWQFVFILKNGQVIEQLLYRRQNAADWQYHSFDLSHYAGQTIQVYFDTFNNGAGGITSMHVDDVSLEVCTGTPPPDLGTIEGTVSLQGRADHSGAEVCADDGSTPVCVQSDAAGAYSIDAAQGSYSVTVDMQRYLDAEKLNVSVTAGNVTNLTPVTCLGGDTNDDCLVNILDVSLIGSRFGLSCADPNWDARADINNDCTINILDISMAGSNFGKTCPVPWS